MTDTIGNSVVHETAEKLDALNVEEGEGINAIDGIEFINYEDESRLESVMRLVGRDLSEPYSGKLNLLQFGTLFPSTTKRDNLKPLFFGIFVIRFRWNLMTRPFFKMKQSIHVSVFPSTVP